jgi:lysophospholipase L1-like esterase
MTPPPDFTTQKRPKVGFIPNNARIDEMTKAIMKLARELTIGLIDINAATACHPECFRFDGVHPDAHGAKIIAETAYAELRISTAGTTSVN